MKQENIIKFVDTKTLIIVCSSFQTLKKRIEERYDIIKELAHVMTGNETTISEFQKICQQQTEVCFFFFFAEKL